MELVVDANILMSAVISAKGKTRNLLFSSKLDLFAPEFLLEEFTKHKREILAKSRLSKADFDLALSLLFSRITFVPFEEFGQFIPESKQVCPDPNDVEYFALALSKNIPFWSSDKALKKQSAVKVLSTSELLKQFE